MSQQTARGRRTFTVRRHVVRFSGGIGSFAVAVRVARSVSFRSAAGHPRSANSTLTGDQAALGRMRREPAQRPTAGQYRV
ncbi:hypothetical protein [Streptomyces mirabilis]